MSHQSQLKIVDDHRAVHGHRGDDALFYEVHEDRVQADFGGVRPHPDDDWAPSSVGLDDGLRDGAQGLDRQDVRESFEELLE